MNERMLFKNCKRRFRDEEDSRHIIVYQRPFLEFGIVLQCLEIFVLQQSMGRPDT
jgi:hypothetical protein